MDSTLEGSSMREVHLEPTSQPSDIEMKDKEALQFTQKTQNIEQSFGSRLSFSRDVTADASFSQKITSSGLSFIDSFFPKCSNRLEIPASFLRNVVRHRAVKKFYPLDNQRTFQAFRILTSENFRKICIVCALILAFLPTIEIPVSVASPCWLSFALEILCYLVFSARVIVELRCFDSTPLSNPWAALFRFSLLLSWVDVIVCMSLVSSSGGNFLSFNNCGLPEPDSLPRSSSQVYLIARLSRYFRPVFFMEWNYRTRYLFRNMAKITGKLVNILSILFVVVFLFAAFAYFVWSDPNLYISTIAYRFDYFRSWPSSFVSMTTLTTTENYPDCMIDYLSVSFVNFFFFLIFVLLSVFFALNVVLSTVYDTYEDNLQTYHVERGRRNRNSIANAFQYLCDADKQISRERFRRFMRVWDGIENIDSSTLANKQKVNQSSVKANFMFSMCCIRRCFLMKDSAGFEDMLAFKNGRINEATLIEKLGAAMDSRISYGDFFELVSLMRCHFVVTFSASSDKLNKSMKQTSVGEIARHVVNMNNRSYIEENPISLHSSSYANSNELSGAVSESKNSKHEAAGAHPVPKAEDSEMDPENLEFFVSNVEETSAQQTMRKIHEHKISKCICSVLIVLQFMLCVIQMLSVNAYEQCSRYKKEDAILRDPWIGCETFTWYNKKNEADVETAFNAANMVVSFFLLADVFVCICVKRRMFFYTFHHDIHFVNIIDAMLQFSIFIYDVVDLPMESGARPVARPVFVAFGVLRLLRVHRVLAYSTTITDTIKLFRHLYPVVKAFFLIAYTFFFVWGILGMSLFSYSATEYGISLYPNKNQYIDYYKSRAPSDYPNGNNPGNFGCNETDILGKPGFCGEYGPHSPEPHWDTTPETPEQKAALDAAFVIGSGFDARVGGCFNLVGEANNRVLPCYCYYNAGLMNRTTSCDWINSRWYNTPLGQVMSIHASRRPMIGVSRNLSADAFLSPTTGS
jgi:hypothetical protein